MQWLNFDKLEAYKKLEELKGSVDLKAAMDGENGAARVAAYQAPMAEGMVFCRSGI